MSEKRLRIGEVAKRLRMSVDQVRRASDAGKIPYRTYMSDHRYYDEADIERIAEELGIPRES